MNIHWTMMGLALFFGALILFFKQPILWPLAGMIGVGGALLAMGGLHD